MPYQGGQRSAKRAPSANWVPQFPGANFFFGKGMFAGRGANASQMAPTDSQLRAEGYGDLVNDAARLRAPTDAQLRAEGYGDLVNDAARLRSPTDAQLRAEGYGDLVNDAARLRGPVMTPAGVVQPGVIVRGLTPSGTVDYSQGDEYKAQLAQYRNLIQQQKQAEAEDLGMKIFMQKYANAPIAQAGGAVGAFNPLLAAAFPETKGYAGTFAAEEAPLYGRDLGASAQGESGPTMESLNPLAAQAAQQEATATQADNATTAGLSAGDRTRAFLRAIR